MGRVRPRLPTSFVAYAKDDRLYVHMSRHDWEIEDARRALPSRGSATTPGFKLYPAPRWRSPDQSVAVDWRDPVFKRESRTRVLPSGQVERREILMESPEEVEDTDAAMKLPANLSPEQLRGLADLEEQRREGRITETEYRTKRRAILGTEE